MANFGNMLQEYYVGKFRRQLERRRARLAALTTPQAVMDHVSALRKRIAAAFPVPDPGLFTNG